MYKVVDLDFAYGDRQVFHDFSMELSSPFSGIIGLNGAGKSTLVKLSLGLLQPRSGLIYKDKKLLTRTRDRQQVSLGVLHENALFPLWTHVFNHLVFVGRARGFNKSEAQEQARVLLGLFDLLDREDSYVNELSAGLKQRFGLAQAFIGLPELVFLDEPTANLDPLARIHVLEIIRDITRKYPVQVILLSHILADLEKYCDEVVILHQGKIHYQDDLQNIFLNHYIKEYVLRYPLDKESEVKELTTNPKIHVLKQEPGQIIVHASDSQTARELNINAQEHQFAITPYKTVLEQLFQEITQQVM